MFDLNGKKAIVTGASGGIGKEIVKALKTAGAEVLGTGTNEEKLKKLSDEVGGIKTLVCNLSELDKLDDFFGKASEELGGVDILINNAGITRDNLAMRMKDEEFDDVIDVNMRSIFRLMRAAIKPMMKQRSGRIINITSIVGVMGNPGQANYCAAKAGIIGMSKSIAAEVASRGITINNIAPGFIETPMTDALTDDQKERITKNIPAGKMGNPSDIASACVYLSSDKAGYMTGQTLHINGGLLMV